MHKEAAGAVCFRIVFLARLVQKGRGWGGVQKQICWGFVYTWQCAGVGVSVQGGASIDHHVENHRSMVTKGIG
jgi:hypothetical protein